MDCPASGKDGNLLSCVQDTGSALEVAGIGKAGAAREYVRGVMRDVALGAQPAADLLFLNVHWQCDVRHAVVGQSRATGQVGYVFHMSGAHDTGVVDANVLENLVEFDVLLCEGADQVVIRQPCNCEHGGAIELCVIESVQQMEAAGARCGQTDSQLAGKFGIAAGGESGRFLVAHLHEADFLLTCAQGLHNAVNAISGQPENNFNTPIH